MIYFLDANVLMHFANDQRKAAKIAKHLNTIGKDSVFVSTITLYELHTKLIKNKVSKAQVDALSAIIGTFKVKNFNSDAALSAAKVRAQLEEIGKAAGHQDMQLAGHAKFERAILVTNNTKDFKSVHGLKIEDWIA
jgi:tRNA(fMet)-specific endonuclease VapC